MPTRKTKEEFVKASIEIHGEKYLYDKVIYNGNKEKVIITCRIHGDFLQTPNDHIGGHNCRKCSSISSHNYNLREAYSDKYKELPVDVYVIEIQRNNDTFLKVGISKEVKKRLLNIKTKSKGLIEELLIIPCTFQEATLLEDILLELRKRFRKFTTKEFTGYSECLTIEAKDQIIFRIKGFFNNLNRSDLVGKILNHEYGK